VRKRILLGPGARDFKHKFAQEKKEIQEVNDLALMKLSTQGHQDFVTQNS